MSTGIEPSADPALRVPSDAARRDLTDQVTVFVTTVGASTYRACMDQLARQDVGFRLEVIGDVTPARAAFQAMVDRCATPFYIQVDEDMLLFERTVGVLHEAIRDTTPDVALVIGRLYDVHLQRPIDGVKIHRTDLNRRYRWDGDPSVVARYRRMSADGLAIVRLSDAEDEALRAPLGLHGTAWTPRSIYERYRSLERLRRQNPRELAWFADFAWTFLDRFRSDPTGTAFFALMGLLAGDVDDPEDGPVSPDAAAAPPVGFAELERYWAAISPGTGARPTEGGQDA